jgi:pimeloyl-ACP methyl ester carboxylesterase
MQVPIHSGGAALCLEAEQFGAPDKGNILLIMGLGTQLIACGAIAQLAAPAREGALPAGRHGARRRGTHGCLENRAGAHRRRIAGRNDRANSGLEACRTSRNVYLDHVQPGRQVLMTPVPADASHEELIRLRMNTYRVIAGPGQSMAESTLHEMAKLSVERSADTTGSRRQLVAAMATGSLKSNLRNIHVPTLIIHGRNDPLIPARRSEQMHRGIAGSKLLILEGMGHAFPQRLIPQIAAAIVENCALAS